MTSSATVIFAQQDLSIPGDAECGAPISDRTDAVQAHFFDLVSRSKPDVIVLDYSRAPSAGAGSILTVRQRTDIPILVVCSPGHPSPEDYRIAGAAECISTPVDIVSLNQTIQKIMRIRSQSGASSCRAPEAFSFAGMSFSRHRNLLAGDDGSTIGLTNSESRLLEHFLSRPWTICTRSEIGALLYGPEHSVGDRAIDVVVTRLRRKLLLAGGANADQLIKTEFRRGYLLATDVATLPRRQPALQSAS